MSFKNDLGGGSMFGFRSKSYFWKRNLFRSIGVVLATPSLLLSACTSIKTVPHLLRSDLTGVDESNRTAIEGVPYALPMLQYELTFTYKITECFNPGKKHPKSEYYVPPLKKTTDGNNSAYQGELLELKGNVLGLNELRALSRAYDLERFRKQSEKEDKADDADPSDQFQDKYADKNFGDYDVDITLEASPSFVEGERYTIDYDALSSVWKTSVFEIANHEETGTLKSINISAEDKTAETIGSTVKLLLSGANIVNPIKAKELLRASNEPLVLSSTFTYTEKVICTEVAHDLVE